MRRYIQILMAWKNIPEKHTKLQRIAMKWNLNVDINKKIIIDIILFYIFASLCVKNLFPKAGFSSDLRTNKVIRNKKYDVKSVKNRGIFINILFYHVCMHPWIKWKRTMLLTLFLVLYFIMNSWRFWLLLTKLKWWPR